MKQTEKSDFARTQAFADRHETVEAPIKKHRRLIKSTADQMNVVDAWWNKLTFVEKTAVAQHFGATVPDIVGN